MATTSEQIVMHQDQDLKGSIASIASLSNSGAVMSAKKTYGMHSPVRSVKSERRPSFSITLPPSMCGSRSSFLNGKTMFTAADEDTNSTEDEAAAGTAEATGLSGRGFAQQRRASVQFIQGEDDNLMNHEGKHGLPKTPYPTTGEEDERIQSSLFKH